MASPAGTRAVPGSPAAARKRMTLPDLTSALDGLTHAAVLSFAVWTLVYDVGLVARLHTSLMLALWAACTVAILPLVARLRDRPGDSAQPAGAAPENGPAPARWRLLGLAGVALGGGAALAAAAHGHGVPWLWAWLLAGLSVAATAVWLWKTGRGTPLKPAPPRAFPFGSLMAAGAAALAALVSLYLVRPNGDDTYYVSRSVWTAQHGLIPLRDVLFTHQASKPIVGEPPLSSIEVAIGAVARLFGVQAGSVTYLVALPVLTFFAVWAVWMLVRRWATRRYEAVFTVAMVYLVWSGASGASFGSFHLVRMWQGKAAFVSLMVPLLYVYLTDWAERRSRRNLVLLIAASVAGAGLSTAAVYVAPLIAVAVAVPLLATRQFKGAAGAAATMVYPVVAGLAATAYAPLTHLVNVQRSPALVWSWVIMLGVYGAVGGFAVFAAPWLSRRGAPALITAGIACLAFLLMVPAAMALLTDATGIGPVLYRTLWVVPGPVLVGLLASVRLSPALFPRAAARWLAPAPALALCGVFLAAGVPLWSHSSGGTAIADHPSWKYDAPALSMARRMLRADHRPGDVLSTWQVMEAVPLITSRVKSVSPRGYYLHHLGDTVSRSFVTNRLLLTGLADQARPLPSESAVRDAVAAIGVGYACVPADNTPALSMLTRAGFTRAARLGSFQCLGHSG